MFHGKIHYKWPFSIAMLVYQRVSPIVCKVKSGTPGTSQSFTCGPPVTDPHCPLGERFRLDANLRLKSRWLQTHWEVDGVMNRNFYSMGISGPQNRATVPYFGRCVDCPWNLALTSALLCMVSSIITIIRINSGHHSHKHNNKKHNNNNSNNNNHPPHHPHPKNPIIIIAL